MTKELTNEECREQFRNGTLPCLWIPVLEGHILSLMLIASLDNNNNKLTFSQKCDYDNAIFITKYSIQNLIDRFPALEQEIERIAKKMKVIVEQLSVGK